ncbi:peptidase inhibitor family I36 protein [Streptomyces sp. 142MFCol3.1]|uniref:peptidase inhibitor family I36 protein n=1 Tax=Streptomyces sp. 142MFCol3.1 TaxID=1172179 RepID=UPI000409134B|nr:peptidase inhibitor family I36 protein [Streptomyces sp. 142MFCol3.1]
MRSARVLAVASAMSVAAVLAATTPAQAASNDGTCNTDEACIYRLADYSGGIYDTLSSKKSYSGLVFHGTSTTIDNKASAAKNRDPDNNLWFYQLDNWAGDRWGVPAGASTNFTGSDDNKWSSHCWSGATAGCPGG